MSPKPPRYRNKPPSVSSTFYAAYSRLKEFDSKHGNTILPKNVECIRDNISQVLKEIQRRINSGVNPEEIHGYLFRGAKAKKACRLVKKLQAKVVLLEMEARQAREISREALANIFEGDLDDKKLIERSAVEPMLPAHEGEVHIATDFQGEDVIFEEDDMVEIDDDAVEIDDDGIVALDDDMAAGIMEEELSENRFSSLRITDEMERMGRLIDDDNDED